jgi:hypothetical protein
VRVTVLVTAHPEISLTVTEYVLLQRLEQDEVVQPLGDQLYVYGAVPPPALALAVPSQMLKQEIFVPAGAAVIAVGCVIVIVLVSVHPFASVIVAV